MKREVEFVYDFKAFGQAIKKARRAAGYSRKKLGHALYDFSYAEIGRMCGCSKAAVHESIEGVRKKFFKFFS